MHENIPASGARDRLNSHDIGVPGSRQMRLRLAGELDGATVAVLCDRVVALAAGGIWPWT